MRSTNIFSLKHKFHLLNGSSICHARARSLVLAILKLGDHSVHTSLARESGEAPKHSSLSEKLRARIEVRGPLTVAEYMRAVLTNPLEGYYMHRDVFGHQGDFTTSPEISQLFGEMIGVWYINELQKFCLPSQPVQFVELGPGRGTLINDVLRVFKKLRGKDGLSVHLVEISPHLSRLQGSLLCESGSIQCKNVLDKSHNKITTPEDFEGQVGKRQYSVERQFSSGNSQESKNVSMNSVTVRRPPGLILNKGPKYYQEGLMSDGTPVFWYYSLQDVPHQFSCFLANEFFDALPIHKFKRTSEGWREILITSDPEGGPDNFKLILSRSGTPSSKIFMKPWDERDEVELSPDAGLVSQQVASRLEDDGGVGLFIDYGYDGENPDTFRAFRKHEQVDPLISPGSADLTADVDFAYIRNAVCDKTVTFGPVSQSFFLRNMGIDDRLKILMENCSEDKKADILSGYNMIMSSMGDCFKFFCLYPKILDNCLKKYPVTGFH